MNYAILRTAKLKTMGNIGGSLAHNYRTINTPNADPNRTLENEHTVATPEAAKQAILDRLPEKRRSDAVLCVEYLITASPKWDGWGTDKESEFFERAGQWLYDKHGKENVAAMSLHRDETTPHLVAYVVPIDQKGKLNCKEFLGGRAKLNKMQTDFADKVANLGLARGKEGSKSRHTSIKEYYHDINNARDFYIKVETPKPEILEGKVRYGERVASTVIAEIQPTVKAAQSILNNYERAKLYKKISDDRYDTLKQTVEPYLTATKGLNRAEIERVNQAMMQESRKIASEALKIDSAIQASKVENKEVSKPPRSQWEVYYSSLSPRNQKKLQTYLDWVSKNRPESMELVKQRFITNPDLIKSVPDTSKTKNKNRDLDLGR